MIQNSTTLKQGELLDTQRNVEDNHKENSTLVDMEKIEGTPFTLIHKDNKWFMVMGDWRVTEETATKDEQIGKLRSEKWLLIMHMIIIVVDKHMENPIIQEME